LSEAMVANGFPITELAGRVTGKRFTLIPSSLIILYGQKLKRLDFQQSNSRMSALKVFSDKF